MNRKRDGVGDLEISVSDMKLLVTAVISFDLRQIVSAFLNVQRLKDSLIDEISKVYHVSQDKDLAMGTMSMSDQLQTVFLRPDTPARTTSIPSPPHGCQMNQLIIERGDVESSMVNGNTQAAANSKLLPIQHQELIKQGFVAGPYAPSGLREGTMLKKVGRLDELLRTRESLTSMAPEVADRRHAMCTKQVTDAVINANNPVPRHSMTLLKEKPQRRKRKNTAPQYNPWPTIWPKGGLSVDEQAPESANQLVRNEVDFPQARATFSHPALVERLSADSVTSSRPSPYPQLHRLISSQEVGNTDMTSQQSNMAAKDVATSDSTTLSDKLTDNEENLPAKEQSQTLCGPFVTFSQTDMTSTSAASQSYDLGYPLTSSDFSDNNIIDPIDLSSILLTDQSLNSTVNDLSSLVDLPNVAHEVAVHTDSKALEQKKIKRQTGGGRRKTEKAMYGANGAIDNRSNAGLIPLRLKCRRCAERFTSKTEYQLHLKSQICSTSYTQTHTCQICGYCALTRQRLIVHLRTHSGERPHRCPFCAYAATQQAPLKRHIQNIHMKQGAVSLTSPKQAADIPPLNS